MTVRYTHFISVHSGKIANRRDSIIPTLHRGKPKVLPDSSSFANLCSMFSYVRHVSDCSHSFDHVLSSIMLIMTLLNTVFWEFIAMDNY